MNDGLVLKAKNTIDRIEKLMNFVRMSNDAKNMRQKENILKDKQPKWSPCIDILTSFQAKIIL